MKITIYELLGMVKDDKAPKKIKYVNSIWEYDKETKDYFHNDLWLFYSMNSIGLTEREVEILEEKKIPEKITMCTSGIMSFDAVEHITTELKDKINEVLDYLKSKGE